MAANDPIGITPFRQFVASLQQVQADQHVAVPGARVSDVAAVQEMNAHLVRHYAGVDAVHSFSNENGSVFDCIPVEQQPALRPRAGAAPATAPGLPPTSGDTAGAAQPGEPPTGQVV